MVILFSFLLFFLSQVNAVILVAYPTRRGLRPQVRTIPDQGSHSPVTVVTEEEETSPAKPTESGQHFQPAIVSLKDLRNHAIFGVFGCLTPKNNSILTKPEANDQGFGEFRSVPRSETTQKLQSVNCYYCSYNKYTFISKKMSLF